MPCSYKRYASQDAAISNSLQCDRASQPEHSAPLMQTTQRSGLRLLASTRILARCFAISCSSKPNYLVRNTNPPKLRRALIDTFNPAATNLPTVNGEMQPKRRSLRLRDQRQSVFPPFEGLRVRGLPLFPIRA